jgi:hypothetical protein
VAFARRIETAPFESSLPHADKSAINAAMPNTDHHLKFFTSLILIENDEYNPRAAIGDRDRAKSGRLGPSPRLT